MEQNTDPAPFNQEFTPQRNSGRYQHPLNLLIHHLGWTVALYQEIPKRITCTTAEMVTARISLNPLQNPNIDTSSYQRFIRENLLLEQIFICAHGAPIGHIERLWLVQANTPETLPHAMRQIQQVAIETRLGM